MSTRKFWPWDYNSEGEIYENVAWDLPGHRPRPRIRRRVPVILQEAGNSTGRKRTPA